MKKTDLLIKCIFSVLYSAVLTLAICNMTIFRLNTFLILGVGAVITSVCFILFNVKKGNIIYPILYGSIFLFVLLFYVIKVLASGQSIEQNFNYIINLIVGYQTISRFNLNLIFIGLSIFISMTTVLMLGRKFRFVFASFCALVLMFCALITASAVKYRAFVAMLVLLCVMWVYSIYLKHNTLKKSTKMKAKNIVVIIMALVLLVPIIYVSEKSDNKNDSIFNVEMLSKDYYERNGEDTFSFGRFATTLKNDDLGGDRKTNEEVALTVDSTYPFYITLVYKDYYDSRRWLISDISKTICEDSTDLDLDTKIKYMLYLRAGNAVYDNKVSVEYEELVTRNFAISTDILTKPKLEEERNIYIDKNDNLFSNQIIQKGFSYEFTAKSYDLNKVYKFLNSDQYTKSVSTVSDIISNEEYNNYLDEIYYTYTAIPVSMPERVDDLAYQIVEKANAKTTIEKVQALVSYLKKYEYSEDGETLKAGEDFVDQFLFENKKGYCTSFASALVMLCRTQGIPARYCEGFAPNQKGGYYSVKNSKMHAWTEVYFDGFGWVIFEPTPAYYQSVGYYNIDESAQSGGQNIGQVQPTEPQQTGESQQKPETPKKPEETEKPEKPETDEQQPEKQDKLSVGEIAIYVTALLIIALAILIALKVVKDKQIYKKSNKQFVLLIYKKIVLLLKFSKIKIDKKDTVRSVFNKAGINETQPFEKALYSNDKIEKVDRILANKIYIQVKKSVLKKHNKVKYFIYKYILFKL